MISHGLIYRFTVQVVNLGGVVLLVWVVRQWSSDLAAVIRNSMSGRVGKQLAQGLEGRYSILWCLPGFISVVVILLLQWLKQWSEQFETYKRISATILRRKLEGATIQRDEGSRWVLPPEYLQWFSLGVLEDSSLLISPQHDPLSELTHAIEEWISGRTDEHSAAIYGDKGTGKSCLLRRLRGKTARINVFGRKPYISHVKKLPAWTDADIKELIFNRHRRSVYRLSYNEIINAAGKYERRESILHAKSGFFRMLWQQSNGNPREALCFWLSSLSSAGPRRLKVGLPTSPDTGLLA
jgi:hypothetical protein